MKGGGITFFFFFFWEGRIHAFGLHLSNLGFSDNNDFISSSTHGYNLSSFSAASLGLLLDNLINAPSLNV